jgi:hypothetical protein
VAAFCWAAAQNIQQQADISIGRFPARVPIEW